MAKIRKPMRLDEDLINWIEEHGQGSTFTAKMEFILRDYIYTEKKRQQKLNQLDLKIKNRETEYNRITQEIRQVTRELDSFMRKVSFGIDEIRGC